MPEADDAITLARIAVDDVALMLRSVRLAVGGVRLGLDREREFCRESMLIVSGQRFPPRDVVETLNLAARSNEMSLEQALNSAEVAVLAAQRLLADAPETVSVVQPMHAAAVDVRTVSVEVACATSDRSCQTDAVVVLTPQEARNLTLEGRGSLTEHDGSAEDILKLMRSRTVELRSTPRKARH